MRGDEVKKVVPEKIKVGETVIVKPGERIPIDGKIKKGSSSIDQSAVTGESVPEKKERGDEVFAGTLNKNGLIKIETTTTTENSTLSKIVKLVEEAKEKKAETEKFVNKFAKYYTPSILLIAVSVAVLPFLVTDDSFSFWLYRALVLLVLACPCAFVISTPVTMVSAMTRSAKNGVLIKGSEFIEKIKDTDRVVFDKTGTLTTGNFTVTDIISTDNLDKHEIMRISASLEANSRHPLAEPIVEYFDKSLDVAKYEVEDFSALAGVGIEGEIEGKTYKIGNPKLFDLNQKMEKKISKMTHDGKTVVILGGGENPLGLIGLKDTVRRGAQKVIEKLEENGIETIMLTGDNERTARAVSEELGIDRYISNLLPDEKLEVIEKLQKEGLVCMVGDGVNDAPALVKSDVGIAMGAAGSDTAMDSADMALMEDKLHKLTYIFELSEKTMKVVKENIFASIGVKLALAGMTFLGFVTLWIAVGIGDVGMALLVTINAILLVKR